MALPSYAMGLSVVRFCGIRIQRNLERLQALIELLPAGSFTCTGLLRCAKYLSKACAWTPDIPHSDYPFKFLDNLLLKISVQWLVTFLDFFDQISETFGMSTVD